MSNVLKVGDEVMTHKHGRGHVVGFAEIDYPLNAGLPGYCGGIFVNRSWPDVKLESGKVISLNECYVSMIDKEEENKRELAHAELGRKIGFYEARVATAIRLRDYPDLPFWSGDIVMCESRGSYLCVIDRADLGKNDEVDHYVLSYLDQSGGCWWEKPDKITLVARGNLWKYFHYEPVRFKTIQDECDFYQSLGYSQQVLNEKSGNYAFTQEEIRDALRDKKGDFVSRNFVFKCTDPELGDKFRPYYLAQAEEDYIIMWGHN